MTGATTGEQDANFAAIYDRLARAWAHHEDLRSSGAAISDLYRSSLHLNEAREDMWRWWAAYKLQEVL